MVFALGDAGSHWVSEGGLGDYMASFRLNISIGPLLAVSMTLATISALALEVYLCWHSMCSGLQEEVFEQNMQ